MLKPSLSPFLIFKIRLDLQTSSIIQNLIGHMASTTTMYLGVPNNVNLSQFTNVQRGTIFVWFLTALIIMIVTAIRLINGSLDPQGEKYEQGKNNKLESTQTFDKQVIKSQVLGDDDTGITKLAKKTSKFSTVLIPLTITFALSFVLGASYAFSFVLYFLIIIPLVLFNLLQFHKWVFEHKVFICLFDNIWVIATFFWLLNIWTTGTYLQPYYMVKVVNTG